MMKMQSPKEVQRSIQKRTRTKQASLFNRNSHKQKRYFSLMLVPSYSSGKTRSIRIPYSTFYVLFFTIVLIGALMLALYFRTQFLLQIAEHTTASLEQVQEAYTTLQETSEEERLRLAEERVNLQSALNRERLRGIEEQNQQHQTYLDSLGILQSYVEDLEEQLNQFEIYRQEILDLLSSRANIPPVRSMLNEMYLAQMNMMDDLQYLTYATAAKREAFETVDNVFTFISTSSTSSESVTDALLDYIALVELTLDIKAELYSQLEVQVRKVSPYLRNYPTIRPVEGRLTSGFGWRTNPWGGSGGQNHRGVDIAAPSGTNIMATGGGTVIFSGWSGSYGQKIIIDHGIGISTLYAHNSVNLVRVGQQVNRGDVIARVGSTGNSTGPHIHYEVIVNGTHVNPTGFFLD